MLHYTDIIAKRADNGKQQTLLGHITDCLIVLKEIFDREAESIKSFCNKWNLDQESFYRSVFLSVYLHDIAKATTKFQSNIVQGKHSPKFPHAFFAMPIIVSLYRNQLSNYRLEPDFWIEACSIFAHHTQLYNNMYDDINAYATFYKEELAYFLNSMVAICNKLGFKSYFDLSINPIKIQDMHYDKIFPDEDWELARHIREFRDMLSQTTRDNLGTHSERIKSIYVFSHSLLKACDQLASKHFDDFAGKDSSSIMIFGSVLKDAGQFFDQISTSQECIFKNIKPFDYQNSIGNRTPEYAILWAPCGRGKTKAALSWAINACRKFGHAKIIFAMPTQITSNAMRIGMSKDNGIERECIGLFHGRSFLTLKAEVAKGEPDEEYSAEELTPEDIKDIKQENYLGSVFHKPMTVTTVDHVIYSFLHGYSQADYALGNLLKSVLVFDEVHYYEDKSLQHLITLFRILRKMKIPHLLMSGTLPEFFLTKVNERNEYDSIVDNEGLQYIPFRIKRRKGYLVSDSAANENVIKEISRNYNNNLCQFVILNTVAKSQLFYKTLRRKLGEDANIMLYHSQFTYKDRLEKERKIYELTKKFSWDEVPGKDSSPLVKFLKQNFGLYWIENSKIEKIDNGNTIRISTQNNSLLITLDNKKTIANLIIDNMKEQRKVYEFIVRRENGKLYIKNKFVLVATQVIEVSLDISCDVMYTELAPPDAIGQRGGRLNRGGKKSYSNNVEHVMQVFEVQKHHPYTEEIIKLTGKYLKDGEYTYRKIKDICDLVYSNKDLLYSENFQSLFDESILFGRPYWQISSGDDEGRPGFEFREGESTVFVVPASIYQGKDENLTPENEVRIPLWKLLRNMDNTSLFEHIEIGKPRYEKIFWICKLKYDSDVGFYDEVQEDQSIGANII
jgi:CRISPR-associated endonuclease/helicase Cas3